MAKERNKLIRRSDTNVSRDLRAPGVLARWPLIGIMMVVVGILIFGTFAYNVSTNGPLLQWDEPITSDLYAEAVNAPNRLIEVLIFGFYVGKELLQVIVVILSLYFIHKRFWPELAMLLIGSGGGALLWYFLIDIFNRPRPDEQIGIVVTDPSFPSGHTLSSVICYGLLAYLLVPKMPSPFWKWFLILGTMLTLIFVGFSRLYLGGHYLTDLLAGYALGIAWAGLVFTLVERISWRRKLSHTK